MAKTKNMVGLKRERVKGVSGLTTEPIFFFPRSARTNLGWTKASAIWV